MRTYTIKGKKHRVYDLESELPAGIVINPDWKNARNGDWVRADDSAIIQVLNRKKIGAATAVSTCIGTYSITGKMDTAERASRHTLNGKHDCISIMNRKNPTQREILFAKRIAFGEKPVEAYLAVYDAKSRNYASKRAALLLKTQRIQRLMTEDMKDVMGELHVNLKYLLERAKDECDNGKNGSDRLRALQMLWDAFGVVPERQKVTEVTGIFKGFEPEQIEEAKRPALPEYQSIGDETI